MIEIQEFIISRLFDNLCLPLPEHSALDMPDSDDDWNKLICQADEQAVSALLYDAILSLPPSQHPPRNILFGLAAKTHTIETDNQRRVEALLNFYNAIGESLATSTILVKGSSLARHYPIPLHRECGDNDLLSVEHTDDIIQWLTIHHIPVELSNPRHVAFFFQGVEFECHRHLLYRESDPLWSTSSFTILSSEKSATIPSLAPIHEALFLAAHTEYHSAFFNQPIRFRSLLDWYLLLSSNDFDYSLFARCKKNTDVDVFADWMICYCVQRFALRPIVGMPSPSTVKHFSVKRFEQLYINLPHGSSSALVRVCRRSWQYLRFRRDYLAIYGQSPFARFYIKNLCIALKQQIQRFF